LGQRVLNGKPGGHEWSEFRDHIGLSIGFGSEAVDGAGLGLVTPGAGGAGTSVVEFPDAQQLREIELAVALGAGGMKTD
jgi:hypothetical protein